MESWWNRRKQNLGFRPRHTLWRRHFEGIRFYNKRVFRLEDHMDRLYNCAHYLLLDIPYTQEELSNAVCERLRPPA